MNYRPRFGQALSIMFVVMLVVAGCGGEMGATSTTSTGASGESTTTDSETPPSTSDGVPNACALIGEDELSEILGVTVGLGSGSGASTDRSICIYGTSGVITAIEIADNYELSRQIIEDDGRATEDVSGVGIAAFYDEAGQLIALGDRYFVGISAAGVDIETLKQAAARLLEGAGEGA
jgi:hypothetical protein